VVEFNVGVNAAQRGDYPIRPEYLCVPLTGCCIQPAAKAKGLVGDKWRPGRPPLVRIELARQSLTLWLIWKTGE